MSEAVNPANVATVPAPAAPDAPAAAPAEQSDTVRLRVATPWCSAFNSQNADGSTLTVSSQGTDVPADQKDNLIKQAAQHGVTLVEVSEK